MTTDSGNPPSALEIGSRRRGDALQKAIFDAVFDQLQSIGYSNLTMDKVATAAHTSKTVLYRRWTSKVELVREALRASLPSVDEVALRGEVRADVLTLLRYIQSALIATRGTAFQLVTAEAGCQDGVVRRVFIELVMEPCTAKILDVLRAGAEHGEVRPEAATEVVASSGPAMLATYSLVHGPELPDDYVTAVAEQVVLPLAERTGGTRGRASESAVIGGV